MELRMPTPEELRFAYGRDLAEAFPPQELKPLRNIEEMAGRGKYAPLCLYDGGEIAGECFLWLGRPGWALLDYLCVTRSRRDAGLGAHMLGTLRRRYPDSVIIGEAEAPEYAPNPPMAARRLAFYRRNSARMCGEEADIFGVRYRIIYWADAPRPDAEILREYAAIYKTSFTPEKYKRYIQIPRKATGAPSPVPWEA
jgi:hypothetical protein